MVVRTELTGRKDEDVLRITRERDALLITEDKDFGELVHRLKVAHAGVVLVRMHGLTGAEQAERVSQAVKAHGAELLNAFTVISDNRMRIRRG